MTGRLRKLLGAVCAGCLLAAGLARAKTVTILFTGETHATLEAVDTGAGSSGGLARRMTAVRGIRREHPDALLVDAGGAFAGGYYDEGYLGADLDRERSVLTARWMAAMGYDAACVGDEELALGPGFLRSPEIARLPLVSANLVDTATRAPLVQPYRVLRAGGVRVGVFGLTTPELADGDFRGLAAGLEVRNPIQAASEAVAYLRPRSDLILALSHLGESGSALVAEKAPGIDLMVNGHRRTGTDAERTVGATWILPFSYQGRELGRVDLTLGPDGRIASRKVTRIGLGSDVPEDPSVAAEIAAFRARSATAARVRLDLYGMGECPYCAEAEREIYEASRAFGDRVDVHFYYILGEDESGRLVSLHGPEEVRENLRQIAIRRLAPDRLWPYLLNRAGGRMRWDRAAAALAIDTLAVLRYAASKEAEEELRTHLRRTERLRIDQSPTVMINNRPYAGRIERGALLRALCGRLSADGAPAACASLPECGSDVDCVKPGYVGRCEEPGTPRARCVYRPDARVGLTVIHDPSSLLSRENEVLALLKALFPGLEVARAEWTSPRGRDLIARHGIRLLPAYVFDARVTGAANFPRASRMFRPSAGEYLLDPERAGATVRLHRPPRPRSLDVFLSPSSTRACAVVRDALLLMRTLPRQPDLAIHYMVGAEPDTIARFDREESARQAVVRALYPDRHMAFFLARCEEAGSSYWRETARKAGLDPDRIEREARGERGEALLRAEADLVRDLGLTGEIAFVLRNREVVAASGKERFREMLERMMGASP